MIAYQNCQRAWAWSHLIIVAVLALSFSTKVSAQEPNVGTEEPTPEVVDEVPQESESDVTRTPPALEVSSDVSAEQTASDLDPTEGPESEPTPVVQDPEEEDEEDEEEGTDRFYFRLELGLSAAGIARFSSSNFLPEGEVLGGRGALLAGAFGVRLWWFSFGASTSFGPHSGFDLNTVGGELTFTVRIPYIQPYVRVGLSYAWIGRTRFTNPAFNETSLNGTAFNVGAGLALRFGRGFSLGAGLDFVLLDLTRDAEAVRADGIDPSAEGSALGAGVRLHLHFNFYI